MTTDAIPISQDMISTKQMLSDILSRNDLPQIKPMTIDLYQQTRADMLNEQAGGLDGMDCPICKNKGVIYYVREGAITGRECECMTKRRSVWEMKYSGLGDLLIHDFENFTVSTDWQARMKLIAERCAESDGGEWLLCSGQNGSGKTHICTAVCKRLMERGYKVRYELWTNIYHKLTALRFDDTEYEKYLSTLNSSEILYIDDFLKVKRGAAVGTLSDAEVRAAYEVINLRAMQRSKRKRTIISCEYLLEELNAVDIATAGRIKEKCKGYMIQIARDAERDMRSRK